MTTDDGATHIALTDGQESPNLDDLAAQLFEHMQGQINFADTKAQLTLAADALLAAVVVPLGREAMIDLLNSSTLPLSRLAGLSGIGTLAALLLSIYFALVVARPVLHVPEASGSLFYFGYIARRSEADFIKAFLCLTSDDVKTALLVQIYARSKIAWRKFAAIRHSLDLLVVALVLWVTTQILLAFAG